MCSLSLVSSFFSMGQITGIAPVAIRPGWHSAPASTSSFDTIHTTIAF